MNDDYPLCYGMKRKRMEWMNYKGPQNELDGPQNSIVTFLSHNVAFFFREFLRESYIIFTWNLIFLLKYIKK